nr:hypothetical protein [Tanacetum cinerariifolium]
MIAYLTKSNASEGFHQIIDFLNGSSIEYALTVNPNIYVSCIKQFWTSVAVKKVNDVIRLQALVVKKKVVITKASIRDALRLDCRRKQVGDLSSHSTKYTSPALTHKVFTNMRWVGKGFYRVETPLFEGMIVEQQVDEGDVEVNVDDVYVVVVAAEGVVSAANADVPTAIEEPSIPSPTLPTPPPQSSQDIPLTFQMIGSAQRIDTSDDIVMDDISKQEGIITNIDADEDVVLEDAKDVAADAKDGQDANIDESADIQGRTAESQA